MVKIRSDQIMFRPMTFVGTKTLVCTRNSDTGRLKHLARIDVDREQPDASTINWKQLASKDQITFDAMLKIMQEFDRMIEKQKERNEKNDKPAPF